MEKTINTTTKTIKKITHEFELNKNVLLKKEITTTYEITHPTTPDGTPSNNFIKFPTDKKVEIVGEFPLFEISEKELRKYRKSKVPSFILKVDNKFYYAQVTKNINLFACDTLGRHKCSCGSTMCKRLSAASDEDGGCAKVRDIYHHLEQYPWIKSGYETFNTNRNAFVVLSCDHFEKHPPRTQKNSLEVNRLRLGLAQYYWEDVTSLAEVFNRKKELRQKQLEERKKQLEERKKHSK